MNLSSKNRMRSRHWVTTFLLFDQVVARSAVYEPLPAVASCLKDVRIFAAGPSELAGLLGWLTGGAQISTRRNTHSMIAAESAGTTEHNKLGASRSLACTTRRNLADRHFQCAGDYRKRATCREELYERYPFEANCSGSTRAWHGASIRVRYYWKSFMYSSVDETMAHAALQALNPGLSDLFLSASCRVIVVVSGGLQHWGRFVDHHEGLLHNVGDAERWPQAWIDS